MCHLFQAECLRTELDMIVQPLPHFALFIFYRHEVSILLLYNIGKAAEAQTFRPDPDSPHGGEIVLAGCLPAITAFVPQGSFEGMMVFDKFAEDTFIVEASRTILQGIQV